MRMERKILALARLLSVATISFGATTFLSLVHNQPLAACHAHPHRHSPTPVNHLCCGAGHQAAILQNSATSGYSPHVVFLVSGSPKPMRWQDSFMISPSGIVLPGTPPGKTLLRV
jgi:hypothetical protein